MKRFIAFQYDTYYPLGGMRDFYGDFDTFEEAATQGRELLAGSGENYDIFDTEKPGKLYAMYARDKGKWIDQPPQSYDIGSSVPPRRKWISERIIVEAWLDD